MLSNFSLYTSQYLVGVVVHNWLKVGVVAPKLGLFLKISCALYNISIFTSSRLSSHKFDKYARLQAIPRFQMLQAEH